MVGFSVNLYNYPRPLLGSRLCVSVAGDSGAPYQELVVAEAHRHLNQLYFMGLRVGQQPRRR
jgi:hypothetical protein